MNRIKSYEELTFNLVRWIKDYYWMHSGVIKAFVVGVSGGIDSAVVSTLCAITDIPTYVLTMPLHSKTENTELSEAHAYKLVEKYSNVTLVNVDLSETYDKFMWAIDDTFTSSDLTNANTKARLRMSTLYQIAGSVGGIVVGTGNKVDLYKTEVWELGKFLDVDPRIIEADPTDGLWDDSRTDEDQLGASYAQLEEAMELGTGPGVEVLKKFQAQNKHKMEPIPTFKL